MTGSPMGNDRISRFLFYRKMRPSKRLRGDRTVAMTKDVARGRSDLSQGKNPERGYAFYGKY